jgi:hypothetical protein
MTVPEYSDFNLFFMLSGVPDPFGTIADAKWLQTML